MMYLLKVKIFSTEAALMDTSYPYPHVFSKLGAFVPCQVKVQISQKIPSVVLLGEVHSCFPPGARRSGF